MYSVYLLLIAKRENTGTTAEMRKSLVTKIILFRLKSFLTREMKESDKSGRFLAYFILEDNVMFSNCRNHAHKPLSRSSKMVFVLKNTRREKGNM